mgnify:FL=1
MDAMTRETHLTRILREKNISADAVGAVIGVRQRQSVTRKLAKQYPFKLPEAKKIHSNLLPEYDFDYLFDEYVDIQSDDDE